MQLTSKQLNTHLIKKNLLPIYLIHGDTTLLVQEARDQLRNSMLEQGFTQCRIFDVNSNFNWYEINDVINHYDLLSEKILIEIRNPKAKFDGAAKEVLTQYLKNPPSDKRLLLITDKLTLAQQNTQSLKIIENAGAIITVWPISRQELPSWIESRARAIGITLAQEGREILADLTEGNLLATQQTLDILSLLYPNQQISTANIENLMTQNARFSIFDLTHYVLLGNTHRSLEVLSTLKITGIEPPLILWALTQELREMFALTQQIENGRKLSDIIATQRSMRKPLLKPALSRLSSAKISDCLLLAEQMDWTIKGLKHGNVWRGLEQLILGLTENNYRPI